MKSTAQRTEELRRRRSEALVEEHLNALFRRMPALAGFALRDDLEVADIAFDTWPGHAAEPELHEELAQTLADLADLAEERPETVELLRGRTFARALH